MRLEIVGLSILMMCFDDVVERAGVEPACRLFSGRDYSPTPGSTRGHSPNVSLSCEKPDYLHRPSGVNDIILIWGVAGMGIEPMRADGSIGYFAPHASNT